MRSRTVVSALALALLVSAQPALANQAIVAPSHAGAVSVSITATQLAPLACDGLNLTTVVTADSSSEPGTGNGSGGNAGGTDVTTVQGTDGNDLLLGTPGADRLQGGKGTDCLVSGGGADTLDGGQDHDVCIIGTPEDDTRRCETVV